ncbi:hypothetical protein CIHG_07136 [Coccidioides immitis H538.4]|uniref:Oxo-4-hydroxy-4-carboxy-5-ureidoimidazoline decarboxylase domain-containing protein n=1 Tax=Coccidioides immitis H538.4 TaxID=396776 RepID=A0A0J8RWP5_COCIT|nr:hypothetical protein CIHG_07136 [Coccidioides immitis H538.4]
MNTFTLPDISTLPALRPSDCNQILDTLFEPSKHLHSLTESLLLQQKCISYEALIDLVRARLISLASSKAPDDRTVLLDILGSHPRLGEKAPEERPLSEFSKAEQANLSMAGQHGTAQHLSLLNREYEEKFPGLRYVTFVNGRGRDMIMEEMRRRIERGDIELEILETIQVSLWISSQNHHARLFCGESS